METDENAPTSAHAENAPPGAPALVVPIETPPPDAVMPVEIDAPPSDATPPLPEPLSSTPLPTPPESKPAVETAPLTDSTSDTEHAQEPVVQASETPAAPVPRYSAEDRAKARAAKHEKKEAMFAAILTLALELHERGVELTNDAVQEITGLSDTTTAIYLRELVTRGFLIKHGKGRGVRYVLVP